MPLVLSVDEGSGQVPSTTPLLTRQALNLIAVRAEPFDCVCPEPVEGSKVTHDRLVEAQESICISTGSMRTDFWVKRAGSIVLSADEGSGQVMSAANNTEWRIAA